MRDRPSLGKSDLDGAKLIPAAGELSPDIVAPAIVRFLRGIGMDVADAPIRATPPARPEGLLARAPTFCAGCPHNTSTKLPDGSFALAGIGCHVMAVDSTPATKSITQMGGEGVAWLGLAPFADIPHMFANMGDGTYQHSGLLAIRQALVTGTNITFKILYNDAVAMTGGQPAEGGPTVPMIAQQVAAEGVKRIAVVIDDEDRLPPASAFPAGTTFHQRDALDAVQRELRETKGTSVLIYDQVCATEKRRRRKRGTMAQPNLKVNINARVCENCGDCTVQSHCIAVEPVETEYGRKRRISPTSCNTDLSCLKGFCPSFVTSETAPPAIRADASWEGREKELAADLPVPHRPVLDHPWRALFAGIGGGGIVTSGAIVAMAAHLEGREVSTLDFTGLAQKNGAVVSHIQIADAPIDIVRIPNGEADVMIAADLAVGASAGVLERCAPSAAVVGNLDLQSNATFLGERDLRIDPGLHRRAIERVVDAAQSRWVRAAALSEHLFGTAQVENTLLLGLAWQRGLVPVGEAAMLRAIELNGTAVPLNRRAFLWGRILAVHPELAEQILAGEQRAPETLDALIEKRAAELVAYQGEKLAARYRALVARAAQAEGAPGRLTRAVAEGYFRVLAYKDEYEVARLHADRAARRQPRLPHGAAAHHAYRQGDRPPPQDRRPGPHRAAPLPPAPPRQASPRHRARPVRLPGRSPARTPAHRAIRGRHRPRARNPPPRHAGHGGRTGGASPPHPRLRPDQARERESGRGEARGPARPARRAGASHGRRVRRDRMSAAAPICILGAARTPIGSLLGELVAAHRAEARRGRHRRRARSRRHRAGWRRRSDDGQRAERRSRPGARAPGFARRRHSRQPRPAPR